MKKFWSIGAVVVVGILIIPVYLFIFPISQTVEISSGVNVATSTKTALFANGCFWCVEADFEKLTGILNAESGYADGVGENPTYKDYGGRGFREVVKVTYDPTQVSFAELVEQIISHGDPTDGGGSFYDRGYEYSPGIYYENEEEKVVAVKIIADIGARKIFDKPLALTLTPRTMFWSAEEYHQDYYKKNPVRYAYYRKGSGRDAFIEKYWGKANISKSSIDKLSVTTWRNFVKPSNEVLRKTLTPIQYEVTQEDGTETPFKNEYDKEVAEGIYVDVVSGEPLYSSKDKYDSGTGWPSFVKPLVVENVVLIEDRSLFFVRTEIRSKYADSHLGHVFKDGPQDRGGLRYCMNSAALRFVPKEKLTEEGYGEYLAQFNNM